MTARGFTIVEVAIVIVVLGILSAIVAVSYGNFQERARNTQRQNDIKSAQRLVENFHARKGYYPKTTNNPKANWRSIDVLTDDNCANGSSQKDWIPELDSLLPQSVPNSQGGGADGKIGCYLYASDGTNYVISAWNMLTDPQTETMYRRLGFREFQTTTSTQFYTCNSNTVGGATSGYNINKDYYKHSYTVSNITDCNETPPPGA